MTLTFCWDLSAADWIARSDLRWSQLVGFGPAGFDAYARLRFLPDPAYPSWPGQYRLGHTEPAFVWSDDHTWCVAKDVDPHWAGIGGRLALITQLTTDARLDVILADPSKDQPLYQ